MEKCSVEYLVLYAEDIRSLSKFYQDVFGLGQPAREDRTHVGFQLGTIYLGFEQSMEKGQRGSAGFTPWFTVSNLFEVVARAKMAGAKVRMEPERKERGVIVAALVDPSGNLFGLHQSGT